MFYSILSRYTDFFYLRYVKHTNYASVFRIPYISFHETKQSRIFHET